MLFGENFTSFCLQK
jgi:hypothetical protein